MENVFLKLLNMSITASWLVLAVVVLRLFLKKAPKWINTVLWAFVGFRLICPFSFESVISLIPSAETVPADIVYSSSPAIHSGIPAVNSTLNPLISQAFAPDATNSVNPLQITTAIAAAIWITGIIAMILYAVISFVRLHKKVREGVVLKDNIWLCDRIDTPFILGLFKPRVFLPSGMAESDMEYVIAHEKAHLKRNDHWWKPVGFLLLTVYWFNPVMWIAYILLCRDIELACDEKVIKEMGTEIKKPYSEALINCSVSRRTVSACPLAFGETGVKGRIKSVLSYKKPALWVIIIAVISCVVVAVFFLTNPVSSNGIVERIVNENGYTITNQEKIEVTLSIPKTSLPESIYSKEGYEFTNDEVIAYKDAVTTIFLKQVRFSNEGNNNLYFCFDFSYDAPKDGGKLISPLSVGEKSTFVLYNSFVLHKKDKTMRDQNTVYEDAVQVRGQGDNNQIWFYVSTDALRQAEGTMSFDIYLNRITYLKDGMTTSDDVFDYTKAADEVRNEYSIMAVHCPHDGAVESSILIGEAYGVKVADFLDNVKWKRSTAPLGSLSSPGSVEFVIDENYRITVYERKKGSVFAYAVVKVNDEEIYYHASYDDYMAALAIVHPPITIPEDANEGYYSYSYITEKDSAYISLNPDTKSVFFSLSRFSNYLCYGAYTEDDDYIVITADDMVHQYTFRKDGENLIFVAAKSSAIPEYKYNGANTEPVVCIPDGAVFQGHGFYQTYIDKIYYDIDNDGIKEDCIMDYGPTSGLFTVKFSVYEEGKLEYFNIFNSNVTDLHFGADNEGNVIVRGQEFAESDYAVYATFDISIENGNVVLGSGDSRMAYWGEQGIDSEFAPQG